MLFPLLVMCCPWILLITKFRPQCLSRTSFHIQTFFVALLSVVRRGRLCPLARPTPCAIRISKLFSTAKLRGFYPITKAMQSLDVFFRGSCIFNICLLMPKKWPMLWNAKNYQCQKVPNFVNVKKCQILEASKSPKKHKCQIIIKIPKGINLPVFMIIYHLHFLRPSPTGF